MPYSCRRFDCFPVTISVVGIVRHPTLSVDRYIAGAVWMQNYARFYGTENHTHHCHRQTETRTYTHTHACTNRMENILTRQESFRWRQRRCRRRLLPQFRVYTVVRGWFQPSIAYPEHRYMDECSKSAAAAAAAVASCMLSMCASLFAAVYAFVVVSCFYLSML